MNENNEKFMYSVEQMRIQRHDFMNYLQVIYGYMQIDKPQEAIKYIKNINSSMIDIGNIYSLNSPEIGLVLQEFFANCSKYAIKINFYTELEYITCDIFSKNINEIRNAFNNVLEIIVDARISYADNASLLYMNIYEIKQEIIFIIGISNEVIDAIYDEKYCGINEILSSNAIEKSQITIFKKHNLFEAVEIRIKP